MLTRFFLEFEAEADREYETFTQTGTQTALRDTSICRGLSGEEAGQLLEGLTSTERNKQLGTIPMDTCGKVGESKTSSEMSWQANQQIFGLGWVLLSHAKCERVRNGSKYI